jgi:hypothetical protein
MDGEIGNDVEKKKHLEIYEIDFLTIKVKLLIFFSSPVRRPCDPFAIKLHPSLTFTFKPSI